MQAKITSVYDEGSLEGTHLIGAKGFSVMIEADDQKILFDTGRRGRYLRHNMMFLDVNADDIDKVVISHGDADYVGGLEDLLKDRERPLEIYMPESAAGSKGLLGSKGVYVPEELSDKADITTTEGWTELSEHVLISPPMDVGNGATESFMVILARKGPAVIAACSDCGVEKIMDAVREKTGAYPRTYVGGIRLNKKDKEKATAIAALFSERGCTGLYLNHCTGLNGMTYLRVELGLKGVNNFYVGATLELDI